LVKKCIFLRFFGCNLTKPRLTAINQTVLDCWRPRLTSPINFRQISENYNFYNFLIFLKGVTSQILTKMGQKKYFKVRTQIDWKLFYEFNKVLHSILRPIFEPKIRIKTSNFKENIKETERFSRFSRKILKTF